MTTNDSIGSCIAGLVD